MTIIDKYVFSHPTKTGGTSIKDALNPRFIDTFFHQRLCKGNVERIKSHDGVKFCTVRNPYERFISMFNHYGLALPYSLDNFIHIASKRVDRDFQFFKQTDYIYFEGEKIIDNLIRLESFESDWENVINTKLGLPYKPLHSNKRDIKLINSLTDLQKENIYNIYKEDFDLLNYSK